MTKHLGKKIRIIEDTDNEKKIIQDLIHPARLLGINIMYLPDGKKKYKLRIATGDEKKIPSTKTHLQTLISEFVNKKMEIIFE